MDERVVQRDDVRLRVRTYGTGEPVLLLHGWPDTGDVWSEVVPFLVDAGYRCLVPDLRGCGQSSKPDDVAAYKMFELVADVTAIIDELGEGPVVLVGHDWGANVAWVTAAYAPERVSRLAAFSVGHPTSFRSAGLEQQIKSWYTLLFAHEGLGEAFLRRHDYEAMRTWLGHPRVEDVIAELERDGQMRTHLLWYRANIPPEAFVADPPVLPPIAVPTLGVWSTGDFALSERQMANSREYCTAGFQFERLEGFGHWLPLESPQVASDVLITFMRATAHQ